MKKDKVLTPNYEVMERSAFKSLQTAFARCMEAHAGMYSEAFIGTDGAIYWPKFWLERIDQRDQEFCKAMECFKTIKSAKEMGIIT